MFALILPYLYKANYDVFLPYLNKANSDVFFSNMSVFLAEENGHRDGAQFLKIKNHNELVFFLFEKRLKIWLSAVISFKRFYATCNLKIELSTEFCEYNYSLFLISQFCLHS